jgi:hypothetical protein
MSRPTLTIEYTTHRVMIPVCELELEVPIEEIRVAERRISELVRARAELLEETMFFSMPIGTAPPPERTLTPYSLADAERLPRTLGVAPPTPALPKEGRMSDTPPSFLEPYRPK